MKDVANIFKLDDELDEQTMWKDVHDDVIKFRDNLLEYIKNSDTPFVLGLTGGYGTGKTYFSTRFTKFLESKDIDAVYCSVWEEDYLDNPFIPISKAIYDFYNKKNKLKKSDLLKKTLKVATSVVSSINFAGVNIDFDKIYDRIKDLYYTKDNDYIKQFKEELKQLIKQNNKKLVLIIDELDRCRPDYAVKTLEIIKHLFDIDGLFVILSMVKEKLEDSINAYYNLINVKNKKNNNNEESYLEKFINHYESIPLNYEKICNEEITEDKLKEAIDKNNITLDGDVFNSISRLRQYTIELGKKSNLSYRQLLNLINNKIIPFCNLYYEPIRCMFLTECLYIGNSNNMNIFTNLKTNLFKQITDYKSYGLPFRFESKKVYTPDPIIIYNEVYIFLEDFKNTIYKMQDNYLKQDFQGKYNALYHQYNNLRNIGSDDNDEKRIDEYNKIAKKFSALYEIIQY